MSTFSAWLAETARGHGDDTQADIARRTGIRDSTIARWRGDVTPSIVQLRALADAYRVPLQLLMVQAGLITERESRIAHVPAPIAAVDDDALLAELRRRLAERPAVAAPEPPRPVRRRRSIPKPARQDDHALAASEREIEDWDTTPGA